LGLAADPLAWARAIHLLSSALVTGTLLFDRFVAEPAFRCAADLGSAPLGRFRNLSARLVLFGLVVALVSGAAWLVLLAQRIGGQPLTEAVGETAWSLLTQTQFGAIWQLRLVCALVLAVLLMALNNQGPRRLAVPRGIALVLGVVFIGTLAWSGHGGATPGAAGYVHTCADILHLVAAAAWVGGLVPLVILMRSALFADDPSRMVTVAALQRFSNLGLVSVAIIFTTGVINTWVLVDGVDVLTSTDYGRLLVLKITLFLAMLGFAAVNRLRLTPRLAAAGPALTGQTSPALHGIYRNAIAEIALGILVFVIVGGLGLMEPAAPIHAHMH
jgi:putative copper resistance protein D